MSKKKNVTPQPQPTQEPQTQQAPSVPSLLLQLGTQMDNIKNTYNSIILRYENLMELGIKSGAINKEKLDKEVQRAQK